LVLDKTRRRFPWLRLIWADGGYNARQRLRLEVVKRSDDMKGFVVLPHPAAFSDPSPGAWVETQKTPVEMLRPAKVSGSRCQAGERRLWVRSRALR
jgi:hypothetical protein